MLGKNSFIEQALFLLETILHKGTLGIGIICVHFRAFLRELWAFLHEMSQNHGYGEEPLMFQFMLHFIRLEFTF